MVMAMVSRCTIFSVGFVGMRIHQTKDITRQIQLLDYSNPVKTDSGLVWSELIISANLGKDLEC